MKYICLVLLTVQNASVTLVTRYAKARDAPRFVDSAAVVACELLKLVLSAAVLCYDAAGLGAGLAVVYRDVLADPVDLLRMAPTALLYFVQNQLVYVSIANLDAATHLVTYQMKILTTAMFSVILMNKQLSRVQWSSLAVLVAGVALVQLDPSKVAASASAAEQNPIKGFAAIALACCSSGFAGIYHERIVKVGGKSVWVRNVQLALMSCIIGYGLMNTVDGAAIAGNGGYLYGFDAVVWLVILLQAVGGILVSLIVKYADSIVKGFACSVAIVLACLVSVYCFNFQIHKQFVCGTGLVILAVALYSNFQPAPKRPHVD